ncbi:MAG: hypothetical protein WCJ41_19490 [Aestuariivirga sp.]|uniref:hypothetical protein n=1 Tax=Aestuariivirga sp. TaxID=2650926 RepID=UPI003016DCD6
MAWKLEPGLRLAIKAILEVRAQHEQGSEAWEACDEILQTIHIETDQRSMEIAAELDELPH